MQSLDLPISDDNDIVIGDLIESDESQFSEDVENQILCEEFRKLVDNSSLPSRHREILKLRYGLEDGETYNFEHIADMYGISAEHAKQIEHTALKILRSDAEVIKFYEELTFSKKRVKSRHNK